MACEHVGWDTDRKLSFAVRARGDRSGTRGTGSPTVASSRRRSALPGQTGAGHRPDTSRSAPPRPGCDVLDEARRATPASMVRSGVTFADAAAEWLRFIEEDRLLARGGVGFGPGRRLRAGWRDLSDGSLHRIADGRAAGAPLARCRLRGVNDSGSCQLGGPRVNDAEVGEGSRCADGPRTSRARWPSAAAARTGSPTTTLCSPARSVPISTVRRSADGTRPLPPLRPARGRRPLGRRGVRGRFGAGCRGTSWDV